MVRTLPWLKGVRGVKERQSKTQKTISFTPPSKKRRLSSPSSDDLDAVVSAKRSTLAANHDVDSLAKDCNRTPSTSPPPSPLAESPMRPGYRFDDRFRMVEDEFDATARLFTAHLHRAEYKRLQRLASMRSPSAASKISRAVDPNAKMSASLARVKKAEERKKGVDKALEKSGVVRQKHVRGGEEEVDSDEDVDLDEKGKKAMAKARDRPTDQWRGTHLASLMNGNSSAEKNGVSLVGLQGITSSTRAAAGYKRPERKKEEAKKEEVGRSWDYGAPIRMEPRTMVGGPVKSREKRKRDKEPSSEEDDLRSKRGAKKNTGAGAGAGEARSGMKARLTSSISFEDEVERDIRRRPAIKEDKRGPLDKSAARSLVHHKSKTTSLFDELDRPSPPPSLSRNHNNSAETTTEDRKSGLPKGRSIESSREKLQELERRRAARLEKAEVKEKKEVKDSEQRRAADEIPLFMVI